MWVLVIDDDENLLHVLSDALRERGCNVSAWSDPIAALAEYRNVESTVDLALVDSDMPGMSGIEASSRLQASHPEARIYLMGGSLNTMGEQAARKAGLAGFVQKPVMASMLNAVLRR